MPRRLCPAPGMSVASIFLTILLSTSAFAFASPGDLKWRYDTGDTPNNAPAIAEDGTIYMGSDSGLFFAFNPDGTVKWTVNTGAINCGSPVIGTDGTIYFFSWDDKLHALNPDGSFKWTYTYAGAPWGLYSSPALGPDGTVYFGSSDDNLHAVNPDGTLKWKFSDPDEGVWGPSVGADGTVYVGSEDGKLYAVNPDGSLKWEFACRGWPAIDDVRATPAISPNGTLYVGSFDTYIYALNPDGTKLWEYKTEGFIRSSAAIGLDGTVYVGSYDNKTYALTADGRLKWTYETDGGIFYTSPSIGSDGTIYIGSEDHYLYALNPDGTLRWKFKGGDEFDHSSPAIAKDGTIYIGNDDHYFYAIEGGTSGYWPTFHADATRTGVQFATDISASKQQAAGVTVSMQKARPRQKDSASLCACTKGLAGFTPVSKTLFFNATTAPVESNATFIMQSDILDGTVAEFWLYKIKDDGAPLPFLSYATSADYSNGAWWMTDPAGAVLDRTAALTAGTQYTIYFVVQDNGEFDLNATAGFIRDPVVLGRSSVAGGPEQPAGVKTTVSNAARREVLPGDMAVYSGWTDFQAMARFTAFNGTVSPMNSTGVFRFNSTSLSGLVEDLQLVKLFEDNFSVREYAEYAPSPSNATDGTWWLTHRNNTHIPFNASLTLGTNYFVNFAVRDNGPYDADPAPGAVMDPAALGTMPQGTSSSTGCMLNPAAGFAPELFMLLIAPVLALLRRRG